MAIYYLLFLTPTLKQVNQIPELKDQKQEVLVQAEENFAKTIKIEEDKYAFYLSLDNCKHSTVGNSACEPVKNKISIRDLKSSQLIQEINLQDINSDFYSFEKFPKLVYEDFNLDNQKDFAVMYKYDSNNLAYYDVYTFDAGSNKFKINQELSNIISGHLSFSVTSFGSSRIFVPSFKIDYKVIKTFDKNDSIDIETRYDFFNGLPRKIYQIKIESLQTFKKITEGTLLANTWSEQTMAEPKDGTSLKEIYTNVFYNFQTLFPDRTFYLDEYDYAANRQNPKNPKLKSIDGKATIYLENYGSDFPDRVVEQFVKDNQDVIGPENIRHSQYSYGHIYKVSYVNSFFYRNIYFFPNFGLVFDYKDASSKESYKAIEESIVKYSSPMKTLLTAKEPVKVILPKLGSVLKVGGLYDITWEASNTLSSATVQINLIFNHNYNENSAYSQESCIMDSAHFTKNTGKYSWTVPSECEGVKLGGDNDYNIRIFVVDWSTQKPFSSDSDKFYITP